MYKHDIKGSIAHATMLGECGIIDPADSKVIIEGLNGILSDIETEHCISIPMRKIFICSLRLSLPHE